MSVLVGCGVRFFVGKALASCLQHQQPNLLDVATLQLAPQELLPKKGPKPTSEQQNEELSNVASTAKIGPTQFPNIMPIQGLV